MFLYLMLKLKFSELLNTLIFQYIEGGHTCLSLYVLDKMSNVAVNQAFYMCTSSCVHLHVYIYTCTSTRLYLHVYIYTFISTRVHLHVYIYTCTSTRVHLHVYIYIRA